MSVLTVIFRIFSCFHDDQIPISYQQINIDPIRDVRVGNNEVDILRTTTGDDVKLGCEVTPTCVHSTCPPSHRCKDIWGDYSCECPDGFSGQWILVSGARQLDRHSGKVHCVVTPTPLSPYS
jgi:hypothetical protein